MGTDKSLLDIDGRSFLRHICEIVRPHFRTTVVVAAALQVMPELPADVCVVRDSAADAGPLAAMLTGMENLRIVQPELEHVWLGSCDAPFVSPGVIDHMMGMSHQGDAVVVRHHGRIQPLGGIYRTGILSVTRRLIQHGERRLHRLPQSVKLKILDADSLRKLDPKLAFLRNINTPEDYRRYVVGHSV